MAQNLQSRIKSLGLQNLYNKSPTHGYDNPPYSAFYSHVKKLVALMLVPAPYVRVAYDRMLSQAPIMNDQQLDTQIGHFMTYFPATWISTDMHIESWNHNSHSGPRTNNYSEGFNNSLNSKLPVSYH